MAVGSKRISFELVGVSPLLMHADDLLKSDELQAWRVENATTSKSVKGDDRSPPWTWMTYLYHDGEKLVLPSTNIMVCIRQAGTQLILKGAKTFKEITQSGMFIDTEFCRFETKKDGKWIEIPIAPFEAIKDQPFPAHLQAAIAAGFTLFAKRAKLPGKTNKHVRVRARFEQWRVTGTMEITKEEITFQKAGELWAIAGAGGLCDWRPGCKTPGNFGMFKANISAI